MATVYKVLGQINPAGNTMTTLYTVPASTQTVISTITVCNQAVTNATFTIAVQPAGASILTKHYINYSTTLPANDTITLTLGITLATTDVIACSANTASVSFSAFGSEIS
jgi:hypothetical protein